MPPRHHPAPDLAAPVIPACSYERVSREEQARGGAVSLEAQRALVDAYARTHGYTIVRHYRDIQSGRKSGREAYQQLLAAVRRGDVRIVIARHIDRFGRNMMEQMRRWVELEDLGARLLCSEEPDANRRDSFGNLYRAIQMWKAEEQSDRTGDLVRQDQRYKLEHEQHWYWRELPFGWRMDGERAEDGSSDTRQIVLDDREADLVRAMARAYLEGQTFARIAADLNDAGLRTRRGIRWAAETVRWMVLRPCNTGLLVWGSGKRARGDGTPPSQGTRWAPDVPPLRLPDKLPRLLDAETVERLELRRQRRSRAERPGRSLGSPFLLAGLLRCGSCGGRLVGRKGPRDRVAYYGCATYSQRHGCPVSRAYRADLLEPAVISAVDALTTPEAIQALVPPPLPARAYAAEREQLTEAITALDAAIRGKTAAWTKGLISDEQLQIAAGEDEAERAALRERLALLADAETTDARAAAAAATLAPRIRAWVTSYAALPLAASKATLADLVVRITVTPAGDSAAIDGRRARGSLPSLDIQIDLRLD